MAAQTHLKLGEVSAESGTKTEQCFKNCAKFQVILPKSSQNPVYCQVKFSQYEEYVLVYWCRQSAYR